MSFNSIKDIIKKHIYVIYSEKYVNASNKSFIERFVAKHPLLRPELIVVNDQLHGFKKASKKIASLEEFPIYLEIEGFEGDEEEYYVDSIELYSESSVSCQKRLTDIIYISNCFSKYVRLERVIDATQPKKEAIIITSKIQEFLINLSEDSESEGSPEEGLFLEVSHFNKLFENHLNYFIEFIKLFDDIIIKNTPLAELEEKIKSLLDQKPS